MIAYILQRTGIALLICMTAMTVLFSLAYVIPGDPASIALGPRATPEMREELRERMGLDQPVPSQLVRFFSNVVRGDLGVDVFSNRPVSAIVFEALPYTLTLIAVGLGWAILIGVPLGCYSAIKRGSFLDRLTGLLSVAAISTPSFVLGVFCILAFSVYLGWFPAIGAGAAGDPFDQARHLILPAFAIGLGWVGYLARLVRASMLEVLGENHIRTARAYGLPESRIVRRYALRIAVLPTITLLGVAAGGLLSSAVFVEIVFNRPGIGQLALGAVETRNYPILMGATLITVMLFVAFNLVADLIIAALDPRVRAGL
jgi:peptide/nickel transport system permease protein